MASKSINWETTQTLPTLKAPILVRGWIRLELLPLSEGKERRIQPICTLCGNKLPTIRASDYARTSNWLTHIRTKHLPEAEQLKADEAESSSIS
jgi:hypothetical protein